MASLVGLFLLFSRFYAWAFSDVDKLLDVCDTPPPMDR